MRSDQLARFKLFEALTDPQLATMAKLFTDQELPAGTPIFKEGDRGDQLYLIGKGTVRITQRLGSSAEEALAFLKEGNYFGDMSLIDARPRSADAIAETDVVLHRVGRSEFLLLMRVDPEIALSVLFQFIRTLTARLRDNNEKVRALNMMSMW
ncbi:MAG: cyclic nucleotide-binding domain-containing protein [Acidobacteriota bacterium]